MASPPKDRGIVVPGGGIFWPQPKRYFEVIARLREIAGCGKKIAQISVRVGVVRLNPDGLSKRGLSPRRFPSGEPDDAKVIVRLGHIRIEVNSFFERGDGIRLFTLRPVGQTQFMPRDGVIRRCRSSSFQELR